MSRLNVPLSISEAPTDRLRVSVKDNDGNVRLIPGARAPTVGQGAGQGATRTPSQYLLGARGADTGQETTLQIVCRALVGTQIFDLLDEKARGDKPIELDFRTFGTIKRIVNAKAASIHFVIAAESNGLSEISISGNALESHADHISIGDDDDDDLIRGRQLSHVKTGTKESSELEDFIEKAASEGAPDFVVISEVRYKADGTVPKAYIIGRTAADFPNAKASPGEAVDGTIAIGDQCVMWTAKGVATSFQPNFDEDSLLYTLDVTLSAAMPKAQIIHPADVNIGNPSYA